MKKNFLWKKISYVLIMAMLFTGMYIPAYALDLDVSKKTTEAGGNEDFSYEPYFNKTGHVDIQCNYVISSLGLTAEQGALLKETCSIVDSSPIFQNVRGLHARKNAEGASNYLANLKALFLSAQLIDKVEVLDETVLLQMPNISAKDRTDVREVIRAIQKYFSGKNLSSEQKLYLISGLAVHLTGDMYAHRAMLKKASITDWGKPDRADHKYFQTRDFKKATRNEFKEKVNAGQLCTVDMKKYMQDEGFEFRLYGGQTVKTRGPVYIDNLTFMPNRITTAQRTAYSFVKAVRSGGKFSDVTYHRDDFNIDLENFSAYKTAVQ